MTLRLLDLIMESVVVKSLLRPFKSLAEFFWGFDVFISYARKDSTLYAQRLGEALAESSVSVFLDQDAAPADPNLPPVILKSLLKSTVLVVIGSQAAQSSKAMRTEVEKFVPKRRVVVPLNVDDKLNDAIWYPIIRGAASVSVPAQHLVDGTPTKDVLARVEAAVGFKRKSRRLNHVMVSTAVFITLLVVIGSAVLYGLKQEITEGQLRNEAFQLSNHAIRLMERDGTRAMAYAQASYQVNPENPYYESKRALTYGFYQLLDEHKGYNQSLVSEFEFIRVSAISERADWLFINSGQADTESVLVHIDSAGEQNQYNVPHPFIRDAVISEKHNLLVTCGDNVRIWTLRPLKLEETIERDCWALALSENGQKLGVGFAPGLLLYDFSNAEISWEVSIKGQTNDSNFEFVDVLTFMHNDEYLVSNHSQLIIVHQVTNGSEVARFDFDHYVLSLAGFKEHPLLLVGGEDLTLMDWDGKSLTPIKKLDWQGQDIDSIDISDSEDSFVFGDRNGQVQRWKIELDNLEYQLINNGIMDVHYDETTTHQLDSNGSDSIREVRMMADDKTIITVAEQGVKKWYLNDDWPVVYKGHQCNELNYCGVLTVASASKGGMTATGGADGNLFLWAQELSMALSHGNPVNRIEINDRYLFSASGSNEQPSGELYAWPKQYLKNAKLSLNGHDNVVRFLALSDDYLASADIDGNIFLWDANSLTQKAKYQVQEADIRDIGLSPSGEALYVGRETAGIEIIDTATAAPQFRIDYTPGYRLDALAVAPDGQQIYWSESYFSDTLIRVADISEGTVPPKVLNLAKLDIDIFDLSVSPDGQMILLASQNKVYLVSSETAQIIAQIPAHDGIINEVRFSTDRRFFFSAGEDGLLKQWLTPKGIDDWLIKKQLTYGVK